MATLSGFQERCERSLAEELNRLGLTLEHRAVEGTDEAYIFANLLAGTMEVWIYQDEAMFSAGDRSYSYERPDYPDEIDRVRAFVEAVAACAKGNSPPDSGSARVRIAKGKRL